MTHDKTSLKNALRAEAERLGFVAFGVTHADHDWSGRLNEWLELGAHGEMGWMEARKEQRASPKGLWPEARSVIALGMSYAPSRHPLASLGAIQKTDSVAPAQAGAALTHRRPTPAEAPASAGATTDAGAATDRAAASRARISVYAQGEDYHKTVKKALRALARWLIDQAGGELKIFVDTAPVMEKPLAAAAGLGWQGKHTNMVSREHGSWLFLGSIYTSIALEPDEPRRDHCGRCTACQAACPTDAFPAPYQLDARRCISYLTIEHKGPIPHELRKGIGNRIYGCDDCLQVCPWNKFARQAAANKSFAPRAELVAPALSDLLSLDDAAFRQVFAGSPIKRIGRNRLVRNAAIAAGNSGNPILLSNLSPLVDDPDPVVAEAARWACAQLSAEN